MPMSEIYEKPVTLTGKIREMVLYALIYWALMIGPGLLIGGLIGAAFSDWVGFDALSAGFKVLFRVAAYSTGTLTSSEPRGASLG